MTSEQKQFVEAVAVLAVADLKTHRVLPSLTIAQAIIESAWGTSELATNAHNYFGIKGGDSRWSGPVYYKVTKEWVDGAYIEKKLLFRQYGSMAESVADHGDFLQQARYAAVLGETDYKKACQAIKDAGYATSPTYVSTLVNCIESNKLYECDMEGSTQMQVPIVEMLPAASQYNIKCPYSMTGKGVVFHNTAGNRSAREEANERINGSKASQQSSIHFFVDENEAVLNSPLDRNTWHAHDGGTGYANRNLWSIEVCRSYGGGVEVPLSGEQKERFLQAERNAAWIVAWLFKKYGLQANSQTIRWHYEFAATACPHRTKELGLGRIIPMVQAFMDETGTLPTITGGDDNMQAFDVFNGQSKNVQGFSSPDVNAVVVNNIPNGRYMVYESGMTLANSSLQGALIRYNGQRIYVPIRSDATELTAISVADAETRWGWFEGGTADHSGCQQQIDEAVAAKAAAEKGKAELVDALKKILEVAGDV